LSQNSLLRSIGFGNNNIVNINLNNNTLLDIVYCANSNLLNTIYLQNGNNILLNGVYDLGISIPTYRNRFSAIGCPNLHCIFVDDVANCNENWLGKDATSTYVSTQAQCEAAQLGTTSVVAVSYKVYPNPTNDTVTIDLGSYQEKVIVTLSNVMGQVVSSKTYAQVEAVNYSITGTTGLYFLNIATTTGEKKIIKVMKK
jgi:Secretion system C-terminal sorting domain